MWCVQIRNRLSSVICSLQSVLLEAVTGNVTVFLSPKVSKAEKVTVQFPYAATKAQAIPLALQRPPSSFPALSLAGAQRARERTWAPAERTSTTQERDTEQWVIAMFGSSVLCVFFVFLLYSFDDVAALPVNFPTSDHYICISTFLFMLLLFILLLSLQYDSVGGPVGQEDTTTRCCLFTGGVWADWVHQCK